MTESPEKIKSEPSSPTKMMNGDHKIKKEERSPTKNGEESPSKHHKKHKKHKIKKEGHDEEPPSKKMKKEDGEESTKSSSGKHKKKDKKHKDKDKDKHKEKSKKEVKKEVKKEEEDDEGEVKEKKLTKRELALKAESEVWKWWEEEPHPDGVKWMTMVHQGPYFPEEYKPLPKNVKFYYAGKHMNLTLETEEMATFYGVMIDHDYTKKDLFNNNFFSDWQKVMSPEERETIKDLKKCDFKEIDAYFKMKREERKAMSKEEKNKNKEENAAIADQYGFCVMDGHRQKLGNFKIEPPGLFRGRGEHPKMGKHKKRVYAKDVIINIGKGEKVPDPPPGQKWKAVQHDNSVTWLACWIENIAGSYKYVMLNPAARLKGEKDWQKYETARKLKNCVEQIRANYLSDMKSKEMRIRQRAVAMYFIDRLALRAGHEKDDDSADTVGCCSLRVEHITLHNEIDDKKFAVEFDFLGKDSMRYTNTIEVEKQVFKNINLFLKDKQAGDDLFDRLNSSGLNKHLSELMEGLTAKVFRTYNASNTLQNQLDQLTVDDDSLAAKMLSYNRANREVAILCNHQRSAPKTFDKQMETLMQKLKDKKKAIKDVKKEVKALKIEYHEHGKSQKVKANIDKKKAQLARLEEQYTKLELTMTDKEENKEIALGTSKLNYLDPRISISWCQRNDVPVDKIYSKTQREKFQWAIDMTESDFHF